MSVFFQILTMVVMVLLTYILFQSFGPRRDSLLYTRQEKEEWDQIVAQRLGNWITLTNIVGTLTSLATAYLFFMGNSKVFGAWIFLCCITIWGGSFVTNKFTKRILEKPYVKNLMESSEQVSGVVASIFWRNEDSAKNTSKIVKYVSLFNIGAVIWLEFALFADIGGKLLGFDSITARIVLLLVGSLTVFYFTLRYGLRGFVFADLFQSPMLLIGVSAFIIGCVIAILQLDIPVPPLNQLLTPELPILDCVLFAFHVTALNLVLVLVTETHWLRMWIFKEKEIKLQVRSVGTTAVVWLLLIIAGFMTFIISTKIGEEAIVDTILKLNGISVVFICAFWVGGIAALFSTADVQIYSFLLVNEFDADTGKLRGKRLQDIKPFITSVVISVIFALAYFTVRFLNLPFEKIIFIIIPLTLNLLPAFALAAYGRRQSPVPLIVSLILYFICSIIGLFQPERQLVTTLLAALIPILVSFVAVLASKEESSDLSNEKERSNDGK